MSYKTIKSTLENHLNTNVTTEAIKFHNTNSYTLNSVPLTENEIKALTQFIEPMLIPITSDRELMSSGEPIKYQAFFQVSIFVTKGSGLGGAYDLSDTLDALFREQSISDIIIENVTTLSSFETDTHIVMPVRCECYLYA